METKPQFLKGCARMLVLKVLSERPMYGYEISQLLKKRSTDIFALGQGTLYPMLYSLEKKGYIRISHESTDPKSGRKRVYYTITRSGKKILKQELQTWSELQHGMQLVLEHA